MTVKEPCKSAHVETLTVRSAGHGESEYDGNSVNLTYISSVDRPSPNKTY